LLLVFCLAALGRAQPAFEVAVVKPAGPPTGWTMRAGIEGGPGTGEPGRITYSHLSLKTVLWMAYNVTNLQISGPAWLDSERYDILAKVPQGASKEQVAVMLQNLLADRFQLVLHHEERILPVYVLLIGNKGSKLKPSEEKPAKDDSSPTPAGGSQSPSSARPAKPNFDKYGFPELQPGLKGRTMMLKISGNERLTAHEVSMERLATDWLTSEVGRVVVDMTGLKGYYDFTLTFSPENNTRPFGIPGDTGNPVGNAPDRVAPPSIFAALQDQLGLKLESRKMPVDVLVVDKANKVPTEN
jgi:uncharacterized protein (TIGR03435 family)